MIQKSKPTRAAILSMAVPVGFSIWETLMCAPRFIFDMMELKAQQNGWKKDEVSKNAEEHQDDF